MRILKKLLLSILGLFALFYVTVLFFAFKPELAETVLQVLKLQNIQTSSSKTDNEISKHFVKETNGSKTPALEQEKSKPNSAVSDKPVASSTSLVKSSLESKQDKSSASSNVQVPKKVAGKSGYVPIQDKSEQVDETEAKELLNKAGFGETGDGLTFDTEIYPYYGMLNSNMQSVYRQIYANALILNDTFAPIADVLPAQLKSVFEAVISDHPELFWLDTSYAGKYIPNGKCVEITLKFNQTASNINAAKEAFNNNANKIIAEANKENSSYDKELYVHNALLDQIEYSLNAPLNQSAYSALVNGKTVCAGYARAFQYLMQQLKIPCYYCTGYTGENHAWNIIQLDDGYYNVDVTWDDTEPNTNNYFNITDEDFAATHERKGLSVNLPACNGQAYRNNEDDIAISNDEVLTSLDDYYADCYQKILQQGKGSFEFTNIIQGENLWKELYSTYNSDNYADGYVNSVLAELEGNSCEVKIQVKELKDKKYILTHSITIR